MGKQKIDQIVSWFLNVPLIFLWLKNSFLLSLIFVRIPIKSSPTKRAPIWIHNYYYYCNTISINDFRKQSGEISLKTARGDWLFSPTLRETPWKIVTKSYIRTRKKMGYICTYVRTQDFIFIGGIQESIHLNEPRRQSQLRTIQLVCNISFNELGNDYEFQIS